jgi:hypothetical protein
MGQSPSQEAECQICIESKGSLPFSQHPATSHETEVELHWSYVTTTRHTEYIRIIT